MLAGYLISFLMISSGCTSLYLASPHQKLLIKSINPRLAKQAGFLLLGCGLIGLMLTTSSPVAFLVWCTWVMLMLTLTPYLGLLFSSKHTGSSHEQ